MGRRSRKRAEGRAGAPAAPHQSGGEAAGQNRNGVERPLARRATPAKPSGAVDRMLARADERPKAPWHPFPLVELCVLLGIVLIVVGFIESDTRRGRIALACGLALASLAGLDTAVREHFGGFRSHSTLLAGLPAILTAAVLFFADAPWIALAIAGVGVFVAAFTIFRQTFRRRTGLTFRA